jgi:hypothetical protein
MGSSPNVENFTLGKGVVYFNRKNLTSGLYTGERDLGNAPSFNFSTAIEKLEHYSSRGGIRSKDKEIISQLTPSVSFSLDEISLENLNLLTLGDIVTVSQTLQTVVDEPHVAHLGMRVDLAFRNISSVIVKKAGGTPTYVNGSDYVIDTSLKDDKIGRIYLKTTEEGGDIVEGDNIVVSYSAAAVTYKKIAAFKNTQIEGFLRFVSDNPAGNQQELQIWRVSLTPSGDTAMIGEDWSTLGFTGEVLKDSTGHPDSPYFDIIDI